MNAIVSLCHFCEVHGPCILFTTQAFHRPHDAQLLMDAVPPEKRVPGNTASSIGPPSDNCEGCRSVSSDSPGYLSSDPSAQITYMSSQYPEEPQLYSVVRSACVRSLNCEVCPGREGPIAFGEDSGAHVLSHTFNLKDSQARGFRRLYSLIVVMMDRVFLINSWPFLVKHLRALIDDLQAKADCVFVSESEDVKSSRALRSSASSLSGPDHLRRIRSTAHTGRSLRELTAEGDLFNYLHKYFVFLLKAGGQRMTESLIEGPPQVMAGPVEASGALTGSQFVVTQGTGEPCFTSLRHLLKVVERGGFLELAYHISRGDQLIVRGSQVTTVTSILAILKELVPETCCRILGYSPVYQESFMCNFLGLNVGVELPAHVVSSEHHILVDILPPLATPPLHEDPLASYKLMIYSALPRLAEAKYPLYVQRVLALLEGEVLSESVLSRALLNLKEEWMNKVKVLYKMSQMGYLEHRSEHLVKLLAEVLVVPGEELPLLQYWRTALSKQFKEHLKKS